MLQRQMPEALEASLSGPRRTDQRAGTVESSHIQPFPFLIPSFHSSLGTLAYKQAHHGLQVLEMLNMSLHPTEDTQDTLGVLLALGSSTVAMAVEAVRQALDTGSHPGPEKQRLNPGELSDGAGSRGGCGTDLLRAHGVHPGHLQGVHLHGAGHGVHVLHVGVSSRHGDGDAHVVVHALLSRGHLALPCLVEYTGREKKSVTSVSLVVGGIC